MQKTFHRFNWPVIPKIVASLAQGEDAESLYKTFIRDVKYNYVKMLEQKTSAFKPRMNASNNPNSRFLSYDKNTKSLIGSNIFIVSKLDELLENSGLRTAIPSDDRYGDISRLVSDRFYTDFNALILRTFGDSYEINETLSKDLAEKIEQRQGKLKLPVMIVNPVVRYSKKIRNYNGLVFEFSGKTKVIEDERLNAKKYPYVMKFNEVDELGLPKFDKKGYRIWYARKDGLSRLCLVSAFSVFSGGVNLANSGTVGRVVIVCDEVKSENF